MRARASESASEPASESASEPAEESESEPAAESESEPAPASESESESVWVSASAGATKRINSEGSERGPSGWSKDEIAATWTRITSPKLPVTAITRSFVGLVGVVACGRKPPPLRST